MYGLNNKIIKLQLSEEENYRIPGLYTDIKTLPFEEIPFNSSLVGHNPSILDLLSCIGAKGHEDEIMAHRTATTDKYGKFTLLFKPALFISWIFPYIIQSTILSSPPDRSIPFGGVNCITMEF